MSEPAPMIDLRTAQNSVHPFIVQAIDQAREDGAVDRLTRDPGAEAGVVISPALHPLANTKNHNLVRFGVYSASTLGEVQTMLDGMAAAARKTV